MICPSAKAEVIVAMRPVARGPATARASCMPASVITIKVPPTRRAATMMPPIAGHATGSATPSAMTRWASIHRRRLPKSRPQRAAASGETAAAAPKTGQDQPKTEGSLTTCRAMTGRNVAGTM